MSPDARRALGFFVALAAVGAGGWLVATRLVGLAAGPEAEVITLLKRAELEGLRLEIAGADQPLVGAAVHFDRFTVSADPAAGSALAVGTLDFTGRFGETAVSSLGLERIQFRASGFSFEPEGSLAPRLVAICAALESRRHALEVGDSVRLAALTGAPKGAGRVADPEVLRVLAVVGRRYRALAWYVRSERGEVLVSEDYQLSGSVPEKPIDERGSHRLRLVEIGREFFFSEGLM